MCCSRRDAAAADMSQWGLLAVSLAFAAPIIWLKIKDTTTLEEDLKFSDETVEDVAPPETLKHEV